MLRNFDNDLVIFQYFCENMTITSPVLKQGGLSLIPHSVPFKLMQH